jgi:hypothetical protein
VLEDWRARLILAELRKVILVASQFFEFLHSLGHSRPGRASRKSGYVRSGSITTKFFSSAKCREGPILLQKSFCMINREICWL